MAARKVLHVIERFNVAGAEIVVRDLLNMFSGSEWELNVCVLHDKGVLGSEMHRKGFPVYNMDWTNDGLNDFQVTTRMRKLIYDIRSAIIHAHNVTPWYFATLSSLGIKGIKRCATLHGFLTGSGVWKKKLFYVFLSQVTNKIAIVSPCIQTQLNSIPFFARYKTQIIPNGISVNSTNEIDVAGKRAELGIAKEDFVIGTVGRMYAEKNIEMQIRLVSRLRKCCPGIKLVVVAKKYDYFKVLQELVKSLDVEKNVVFTGLRRDVPELLKAFDLFLMTSFSEGTSIALLEAMAAELPVIVSDVGGNGELIQHNKNGLLFDVNDMDELIDTLLELINDRSRRLQLGSEAKKTVESFSLESMGSRYLSFYENMLRE